MSISFSSNAFYSDGSSLSGWTYSGITISTGFGNPAPSFSTGGFPNYAYINPAGLSSLVGYTILADMYTTSNNFVQLYFGCNINGVGQMFRLDTRPLGSGEGNGFATTTNWTSWGTPPSNNYLLNANTWYTIKIVINSTATNGMSWYYNNILGGTGTLSVNDKYIGFNASGYLDNIAVYQNNVIPASITYSLANGTTTASQFYINVKNVSSNVPPSTDNTGGSTLTNTNGAVVLATDATRGKVLSFNGTNAYFITNYYLPIIHTRLFWVKLNGTQANNTLSTLNRPLWFDGSNTIKFNMNFIINNYTGTSVDTATIVNGSWYFYTLTYDGTTAKLYTNGVLTKNEVLTSYQTPEFLEIGSYVNGNFLNGYLDNIRCYNTALSQTQIKNIYNYELANPSSFYFENGFTSIPGSIGYSYIVNPNGLAVYIDFTNPSCYPGSGTTFYNLMDGRAQAITIASGYSSRVSYTSSIGLRLDNSGINNANTLGVCLSLTTYTVQTISIWYKIYSIGGSQYLCDARTDPPSTITDDLTSAGYLYSGSPNFGSAWNTAYVNGGSAIATSTATWTGVVNPTTPTLWRNVTIVSKTPAVTYPTIVGRYVKRECLDCAIAFVLVYNRALSQEENANNYNLLLSKMNALS